MKKLLTQVTVFVYFMVFMVTFLDTRFLIFDLQNLRATYPQLSSWLTFAVLLVTWALFLAVLAFRSFFAVAAKQEERKYLWGLPVFILGAVLLAFAPDGLLYPILGIIFLFFLLFILDVLPVPHSKANPPA